MYSLRRGRWGGLYRRRVTQYACLQHAVRRFSIPPVEPLTPPASPTSSDAYVRHRDGLDRARTPHSATHAEHMSKPNRFPVKDGERGVMEHGVAPQALDFVAAAEAEYMASSASLHQRPHGPGLPERHTYIDRNTGAEVTITRVAAPVGEVYVPSHKERHALRGQIGDLDWQRRAEKRYLLDEHAQLNVKKERQLEELLAAPLPTLPKAQEVQAMLADFYDHKLALKPRTAEAVHLLFSYASVQQRVDELAAQDSAAAPELAASEQAASSTLEERKRIKQWCRHLMTTMNDVPWLRAMRQLYTHQKTCFVAPTPLVLERLMLTLHAVSAADTATLHLANRLLLDGDRYVVLPTRTTYAAFFAICQVNNAMPMAVARLQDATVHLGISPDAAMLTAVLKGLNGGGYAEEAVALLSRVHQVPMTAPLMNAALESVLLSAQPLACFSVYGAMQSAAVRPNAETYTLLLLACEHSNRWSQVTRILADMQRRRVRGNTQTLNLLLKGLLKEKLWGYASQLYSTMKNKNIAVWSPLEQGVQQQLARNKRRHPSEIA